MKSRKFFRANKKKSKSKSKNFNSRLLIILVLFFPIIVLGLLFQMYRWQVLNRKRLISLAESQYVNDRLIPSPRGTIYASDGSVLAVDEPVWGVYASLSSDERDREIFMENREEFITTVCEILDLEEDEVDDLLTNDFRYVPLKHEVSVKEKVALEEKNLFGLHFEQEKKRVYPDGNLACHLIGFIGKDDEGNDVGRYGLEGYYAGDLLGQEGFEYEEKDSKGNVILTGEYNPVLPRQGKNIILTIKPGVQRQVEKYLMNGVKETEAKSGSAIVMDPSTGAILAMANYPTFDPNYYWQEDKAAVFRNRAVSDVYEYGSVNKVLTVSAAMEEGHIDSDTICSDHEGKIEVADKTIYTWDKLPDGDLKPKDILSQSNNVCAVKTGQKVGVEDFNEYLREFGIGDFIGVGLEDEATSYLKPVDEWNEVDLAVASFGQSISATPLQIISAISAVANDGTRMRPYIVKRLYDEEETIEIEPEIASKPISSETAEEVQVMMEAVVREGESKWWFQELDEYSIAGKTGTAQIPLPDRYGYYEDKTNVTFVGFSPIHDAEMIMLVRLEEPQTNTLSAYTVVPAWVEIYKNIAMELGIAPNRE